MKKLLNILSVFGLTATASTSVVACNISDSRTDLNSIVKNTDLGMLIDNHEATLIKAIEDKNSEARGKIKIKENSIHGTKAVVIANAKNEQEFKNEVEVTFGIKGMRPTIYLDENGKRIETFSLNLIDIKTEEIIQIGSYEMSKEKVTIPYMPKKIKKVPKALPPEVNYLYGTFAYSESEVIENLSDWNTSNVINMKSMFYEAEMFNQDLSKWDTSNVRNMSQMFYEAQAFNKDISSWDTSRVTEMTYMFTRAKSFNQDLHWDVSKVESMQHMFALAEAFNGDISGWVPSRAQSMSYMFLEAKAFNKDISSWDTSKVGTMSYMFSGAEAFNQNLSGWNVDQVIFHDHFDDQSNPDWTDEKKPNFIN